jgi:uncharacterized protein (DUF1330 family)
MNLINIFPDPSKLIDIENTNKIVLFIFLKITNNSIKENIKNDFLKENINILHWFDCQYTNIGKEDFWSDALIIEFKNKNNLQEIYKSDIGRVHVEAIQVFNLAPKNPPRLLINFLKLFRPIGYFLELINNSRKELQNLENRNSNLLPTKKQAERILKEKSKKKAFMINLLQSRKTAKYKDCSISISGREAYYEKYGKTATKCVLLLGGDVTYSGRVLGDKLIEYNVPLDTTGNWEAIGIIEYPKAVKMLDLEKMPGYSKALLHREAGLEKTYNLYATKNI